MRLRENNTSNSAIDVMKQDICIQDDFMIGSFWYDIKNNELFGIDQVPTNSREYYHSKQFNAYIRTGPMLHQTRWKKEIIRGKDKRFFGDYTQVPRGRVFDYKDIGPVIFTGIWIEQYPEAKQEIMKEFDLPKTTLFLQDSHWDIGHGWSDEF